MIHPFNSYQLKDIADTMEACLVDHLWRYNVATSKTKEARRLLFAILRDYKNMNSSLVIMPTKMRWSVKLPQSQLRTRTYTQTGQSTLRATQVRAALSHAYAVTYQNMITDKP
jgi:hypothetical protein